MRKIKIIMLLLMCLSLLAGCSSDNSEDTAVQEEATSAVEAEAVNADVKPPLITVAVLPESHRINVEKLRQYPNMPTGCEITSLTCLLNFLGFPVTKEVMADTYLDRVDYSEASNYTFYEKFIGDPYSNGYGCYAPVILRAATEFLNDQNSTYEAVNISGSTKEEILLTIASGHPIVIWNTLNTMNVEEKLQWITPEGKEVYWTPLEHCMLLTGYDLTTDTVYLCDPMKGYAQYNLTQFFKVYDDMNRQAVTIY